MRNKFLIASFFLISACVNNEPVDKQTALPEKWFSNRDGKFVQQEQKPESAEWWKEFNDETLNILVAKALANNQNKKIIEERLFEARALRESAFAGLFPQINLGGNFKRGKEGVMTQNQTAHFYESKFDASYELDLWWKNADKVSAADATISAIDAEYNDYTISLIAEVAREYTDFRNFKTQHAITKRKVQNLKKILELQKSLIDAGLASKIQFAEAEANLKSAEAALTNQDNQKRAAGLRISVLTAEEPAKMHEILVAEKPIPVMQKIPALAAPAEIISKRPDVINAEKKLESANASFNAQRKEIYPKINIASLFGYQDAQIMPGGKIWSLGTSFSAPILNFGRIEADIDASKARENQAFHEYKQKILEAISDIETSLNRYSNAEIEYNATIAKNNADANQLLLVDDKNKSGLVSYLDVLFAEQNFLNSLSELSNSEASKAKASIAIYKALAIN